MLTPPPVGKAEASECSEGEESEGGGDRGLGLEYVVQILSWATEIEPNPVMTSEGVVVKIPSGKLTYRIWIKGWIERMQTQQGKKGALSALSDFSEPCPESDILDFPYLIRK